MTKKCGAACEIDFDGMFQRCAQKTRTPSWMESQDGESGDRSRVWFEEGYDDRAAILLAWSALCDAALAGAGDFLGPGFLENGLGPSNPVMIVSMHREKYSAFSQPGLIAPGFEFWHTKSD